MATKKPFISWQIYLGLVLLITGSLFLADQLLELRLMDFFWPLLIVLFGITFFVGMFVAGKKGAGLAVPGTLLTVIGLILFVQNVFSLWVTWTYSWTLLISATGLGLLVMNAYLRRDGLRRVAGLIIGIGLILFVLLGVFFEIILDLAGTDVQSGLFLGSGLILLGLFVLFSRPLFTRKDHRKHAEQASPGVVDGEFADFDTHAVPGEDSFQPLSGDDEFSGLVFKSLGQVILTQGEACGLKVEGSQELLDKIVTEVLDGRLVIKFQADLSDWTGLNWIHEKDRLRYYVTVKELDHINLGGAGSISADTLYGERLRIVHSGIGVMTIRGLQYREIEVDLSGLGEITLDGEVETQNVDLSGAGSYKAVDLKSQHANLALTGAGSAKVWVEAVLNGRVSGAGNIHYKGSPAIEETKTGLGGVKPIG